MKRFVIAIVSALMAYAIVYADRPDEKEKPKSSQRGWLGVSIQDITPELKRSMDLKTDEGALVSDVSRHSPADSAGIQEGDVIIWFDNSEIVDTRSLQKAVSKTKPGTKVSVTVLRKGERKTLEVTVGKYPKSFSGRAFVAPRVNVFRALGMGTYGLQLMQLNDQLAEYFGAPGEECVLVEKVERDSPAEKAGFKAGDVILHIGKKTIDEIEDISRALRAYDEEEKVEIEVLRKGSRKTLTLEIEEDEGEDTRGFHFRFGPWHPQLRKFQFNVMPDIDFEIPEFDVDFPEFDFEAGCVEFERFRPEFDVLRHGLNTMKHDLHRIPMEIHKELKPLIKPRIGRGQNEI